MAYMKYDPEKFIPFEEVEKFWEKSKKALTMGYVHNPFCHGVNGKSCKFCIYRGTTKATKEEVNDYYFNYLPKQFEKYKNVIKGRRFSLIAFGGGTPNYLSAEEFEKFLKLLPKEWKNIPKQIELHTAYITKEWLEMLAKYNFKLLTFCIQTFDEEILKNQNRLPPVKNTVELMKYANELGMYTAVDLISYWSEVSLEKNKEILINDLKILREAKPDEISIALLCQERQRTEYVEKDSFIREAISAARFDDYWSTSLCAEEAERLKYVDINPTIINRFFKEKNGEAERLFDAYCRGIQVCDDYGSFTLGIGDYKGIIHDTFSRPCNGVTIYEVNDGSGEAKYYLARNYNFFDEAIRILTFLKEKMNDDALIVPSDFVLTISGTLNSLVRQGGNCCFEQGGLFYSFILDEANREEETILKNFAKKVSKLRDECIGKIDCKKDEIKFYDFCKKTEKK